MCGQPDHIHDTLTEYDHETGVMRFFVKCVRCVWKRLVHEEQYRPDPQPHPVGMYGGLPVVVDEDIPHGPPWIISDQSIRPVA